MLILSRKRGQSIIIDQQIEIVITAIEGDQIKIGIKAPSQYNIVRKEVLEDIRSINTGAIATAHNMEMLKGWVQSHKNEKKKN